MQKLRTKINIQLENLHKELLWECMTSAICSYAATVFEGDPEDESEIKSASYHFEEVFIYREALKDKIKEELSTFEGILPSKLKRREEVRKNWMRGASNQEIAHQLQTSLSTIKRILSEAQLTRSPIRSLSKRKMGTKSKAEVEELAREHSIRFKQNFYTDLFMQELLREGFEFERDELLSFVGVTLAEILQDYRPEKGVKFTTFMDGCLKRRLHDFRRMLMRQKGVGRKNKRKERVAQIYDLPEFFFALIKKGRTNNSKNHLRALVE